MTYDCSTYDCSTYDCSTYDCSTSDYSICMSPNHPIGLTYTICSHSFHLNYLNAWIANF